MPIKPLDATQLADLRGLVQLASQATCGVSGIVEGVHQSVWSTLGVSGRAPGRTGGITGLVYRSVELIAQQVGGGADRLLAALPAARDPQRNGRPRAPRREALRAALNGVVGDHLAVTDNPLAIPLQLRLDGDAIGAAPAVPAAVSGKLLLLIHGLCMNDLQWRSVQGQPVDHGQRLAAELGYTPLYLHYNSGLHIAQNGRALSALLEQLIASWPVPVEQLTVLAHSMGGLVIRSAVEQARSSDAAWLPTLKQLVFLGTPHHGAPLERVGNWVGQLLTASRYSAPFARLAELRSAGITDLRHGHLHESEAPDDDRFVNHADQRRPVPLPPGIDCYTIAATIAAQRGTLADRLTGDGLVPLNSALGEHDDPQHRLAFAAERRWISYRTGHIALLQRPEIGRKLVQWLGPASG
jgi:hypothetical protein